MRATIYLIRGGSKTMGYWFLPGYYNYKRTARQIVKMQSRKGSLKIIKFTSEKL